MGCMQGLRNKGSLSFHLDASALDGGRASALLNIAPEHGAAGMEAMRCGSREHRVTLHRCCKALVMRTRGLGTCVVCGGRSYHPPLQPDLAGLVVALVREGGGSRHWAGCDQQGRCGRQHACRHHGDVGFITSIGPSAATQPHQHYAHYPAGQSPTAAQPCASTRGPPFIVAPGAASIALRGSTPAVTRDTACLPARAILTICEHPGPDRA